MLLDFTVGSYRSFYEKRTLTLQAQKLSEAATDNVATVSSHNVLKTLAVYGANSSGKTNLITAINSMAYCVLSSVKLNSQNTLPYDPFLLLKDVQEPTLFEVSFLKGGACYRYGFSYSQTKIKEEWLFCRTTPRSKEQTLFIRSNGKIAFNEKKFSEGIGLEHKVNDNRLFLSLCDQLGGTISNKIVSWFQTDLVVIFGLNNERYRISSQMAFHKKNVASREALKFFQLLQLGFDDIVTRRDESKSVEGISDENVSYLVLLDNNQQLTTNSIHKLYKKSGEVCGQTAFSFDDKESSGTRKLFDLSVPVFDALRKGSVLVIDELDAKMHPLISQQIIRLFNSKKTNPCNAQLIFTTHDTHLLSTKMLRRDQIWFTEKNEQEQTDLYCLTDIVLPDGTKPRNDANYEKNYIAGRYGAIPYIVND